MTSFGKQVSAVLAGCAEDLAPPAECQGMEGEVASNGKCERRVRGRVRTHGDFGVRAAGRASAVRF